MEETNITSREMEEVMKRETGAEHVMIFNHIVRLVTVHNTMTMTITMTVTKTMMTTKTMTMTMIMPMAMTMTMTRSSPVRQE